MAANPNAKKEEKEKKLKEQRELAALFKPVPTQKVEKGVDPKSILCAFFKQGTCTKGDKCKFSHDLTIERKAEKRSIHVDMRDGGEQANDTIENWTEEKLAEVVAKKHGKEKTMPTTTIVSIWAVEVGRFEKLNVLFHFFVRFANISWMRSSARCTVGSGSVPTGKSASTGTRFRPVTCSRRTRKSWNR